MPTSRKRNEYSKALSRIRAGERISSRVTPFTKIEKMPLNKYKAPRMIQARDITFNIIYGYRYIKVLENKLTKTHKYKYLFGKGTQNETAIVDTLTVIR